MGRKVWKVAETDKEKAKALAAEADIDYLTATICLSRGIDTVEKVTGFFEGQDEFCDPFDLPDMDKAVDRINKALYNGEKICIYGDYDADGVTSTAVLKSFLTMEGGDVFSYIPDRHKEGYGMNCSAIEKIAAEGTKLIITVDNGVSCIKETEFAKSLGMDVVITDHHRVGDELPKCEAVVCAHRKDSNLPFRDWCGVGIVFKLLCALSENDYYQILDEYSDIIALGTIADVVSLKDENRLIVKHGLEKINSGDCNPGINALIKLADVKTPITSTSVSYYICPKINAVGRIETADYALKLLLSENEEEAEKLTEKVLECNTQRQEFEKKILDDIETQLKIDNSMIYDRVIVFSGKGWHEGVIGIVAARLCEKYGKPCFVITTDGVNAKGSARGLEGFSLYDCICSCSHLLTHYGGHPLAAGLSLEDKNISEFRKAVNDYAKAIEMPFPQVNIDCKLKPEYITADMLPIIDRLQPFGQDNSNPDFGIFGVTLEQIVPLSEGKHLRLVISKNGSSLSVMKFRTTLSEFPYTPGDIIDLCVNLSRNEFRGQVSVSVIVNEIRLSNTDDEKYLKSLRLYDKYRRHEPLNTKEIEFLTPDKEIAGKIYKFFRQRAAQSRDGVAWNSDYDVLAYRLKDSGSHACTFNVAIDILEEIRQIEKQGEKIIFPGALKFEDSCILKELQSELEKTQNTKKA